MSKARILVVEDESIVARDVQKTLQGMDYDVPSISLSAEDALTKIEISKPDLVLMDIVLSGAMDGIQAANLIRELHHIPIIFFTAYMNEEIVKAAGITESSEYIIKPIDEVELKSSVEKALRKSGHDM
jgi:CheY-like chemotaxis protein